MQVIQRLGECNRETDSEKYIESKVNSFLSICLRKHDGGGSCTVKDYRTNLHIWAFESSTTTSGQSAGLH